MNVFSKEISYINDNRLKENIEILINMLPDYFFKVPASSTGKYHPSFALNDGGLVRHTKVAVRMAYEFLNNEVLGSTFSSKEKDLMIMALILHDGLKHGIKEEKYTKFEHPILMADYIKENKDKLTLEENEINFITECIESHMGGFNTNNYSDVVLKIPQNKYQKFVHMCDFYASRKFLDVKFENNEIIE